MNSRSYSNDEIAKLLGISPTEARSLMRTGAIPGSQHPITGRWVVEHEAISQFLEQENKNKINSRKKKYRVMIVDDDPAILTQIRHHLLLRVKNLSVEICKDGYHALNAIGKQPPDLLILDNRMPITRGINVLHAIRKNPATKKIKVLVTAGDPDDIKSMQEMGADDVLQKPFSISLLIIKTKQLLYKR